MSVPNPYFIHIELFWPDMTRPNQNQIARVKGFDVNGTVVTEEGQSGYDPATGGWQPVFMQNIAAFYPPREKPNLRFQVVNTAEQVVHTTQVFNSIASGSTVRIVIGQSDQIVGGGGTGWVVHGSVRRGNGALVTSGVAQAFDVTNGSEALLGTASLGTNGAYSISYASTAFNSNGVPHSQPNLQIRVFDSMGQALAQSEPIRVGASNNELIDVTVTELPSGQYRVFGDVNNTVALPVAGILIQAYRVVWTTAGIQEVLLGSKVSNGKGAYEILYTPEAPENPVDCGPDASEVNLIVYAKEGTVEAPGKVISKAPPASPAAQDQRVDVVVDKVSSVTVSEYADVDSKVASCLGATEAARWATINLLGEREDLLSIMARTSGVGFELLDAYVTAWRITAQINADVDWSTLGMTPLEVQAVYGLVRLGNGDTLTKLLDLQPTEFFEALVVAIERNLIDRTLEAKLDPDLPDSLQAKWREVLVHYLGVSDDEWQSQLLELVFPGPVYKVYAKTSQPQDTAFAAGTAHNVSLPSTINAGDLLIAFFSNRGATTTATVTTPTGWTQLFSQINGTGANAVRFGGYLKIAAGNEDGTTVNFVTSADQQAAAQVYCIDADTWTGTLADVVAAVASTGNSTTINPPALTPSWGSDMTLWLTGAGHGREFALSSSPPNYTNTERTNSSTTTGNCTTLSARREFSAASDDPGNFVIASAFQWVAQTIAVRPRANTGAKRRTVVSAHFERGLPFDQLIDSLEDDGSLTPLEAENLRFVFELYDAVDQYFPIVKAVYLDKTARGYQTIADLATVKLDPSGSDPSWYTYASSQQAYAKPPNLFPGDIPGATPEEKIRVYAQRLYDKFGKNEPETRFTDDALTTADATDDEVLKAAAEFIAAHPDFDLQTTPIDKYLTDNKIDLAPEVVTKLKQLQRVNRLTPKFDAALYLIEVGLDSAVHISRLEEGQFIADHEEKLGLTEAQSIHRKAKHYSSEVYSTLVRFNQDLADTGGSKMLPAAINLQSALTETVSPTGKFPNWVTLFGSLYSAASKHCQTVLSPGAYLVDLLDNFLTPSVKAMLLTRRPDLADIELTCANTDRSVPYIDLVNEILAAVIAPHHVLMRTGNPPSNIPASTFDSAADSQSPDHQQSSKVILGVLRDAGYLLTERAVVKSSPLDKPATREWIVEDDAWRFTVKAPIPPDATGAYVAFGAPQTSARADDLDVFPEHSNPDAERILEGTVFPLHLPLALAREEIELILTQRGTTRSEVLETYTSELDTNIKLTDPALALAYLHLTAHEGSAVLTPLPQVNAYWGFPDVSGNVSVPRPESPNIRVTGPWLDVMAEVSIFLHRARLKYSELNDLLDTQFIHKQDPPISIDASDEDLLESNYNRFFLVGLNEERLQRISFFLRAMRKLGWSMRDLDRYLMLLGDRSAGVVIVPTDFVRLAQLARLSSLLSRPISGLLSYFVDLDLHRTERQPKSLFDDVYLRGAPVSEEYQGMNRLAQGEPLELTAENSAGYKNYVRGALRLGAQDFEALWAAYGPAQPIPPATSAPLTVAQLSALYRTSDFCRAMGLSAKDFAAAKALLGIDPFPAIGPSGLLATFEAISQIRRLQASGISARLWQYLLRHETLPGESAGPSAEDISDAHRRVATVGAEIVTRYPDVAVPTTEIVGPALGEVLSADKVTRILDILRRPSASISTEDEAFVADSFTFFLGTDSATFTNNLLRNTADEAARLALVWGELRPFLIDSARHDAALSVTSDLFSARRETIDALLRRALGSVTPSGTTAWEDWVAGLGGWRKSDNTIDEAISADLAGDWQSRWIVPADGQFGFVVEVDGLGASSSALVLTVEGKTLVAGSPSEIDGKTRFSYPEKSYKSGAVVPVRFQYTGSSRVTLLVQRDEGDAAVIPVAALSPLDEGAYMKLWKALTVTRGLQLSTNELEYLIGLKIILNVLPLDTDDTDLAWSEVAPFLDQLRLNRSVSLDQTTLFDLWRADEELSVATVAKLTGWEVDDIEAILTLWTTPPSFLDADTWYVLDPCMRLGARIDIRTRQVLDLILTEPTSARASALRSALRSKYTAEAWRSAFKTLRDQLRQRERDALVGYLTTRDIVVGGATHFFVDANDLLPFFLIDVEMEPDTLISRIVLALNSVQLFVQRIFMGLESRNALLQLDRLKEQWAWMQNYRVWEANRKVFLFPENWIEPELRDDKTELFRELEEELVQDDLTNERAEQILFGYVEGMSELSDLLVVGMCSEGRFFGGSTDVSHLVARTRSKPFTYYYRSFQGRQFTDGVFTPWRKIPVEIEAESVTPALAEGSLRILWPVVVMKEKVTTGSNTSDLGSAAEIRLMWSTLETKSGRWTKPRLGRGKVYDLEPVTVFARDKRDDGPDTTYYHFKTASSADGGVVVAVYKTQYPNNVDGNLKPTRIGTFAISPSGEDYGYDSKDLMGVGNNLPVGAVLLRNAAIGTDLRVELQFAGDTFGLRNSLPFFSRVTNGFRAFATNFGYLAPDENDPFLFETPGQKLFALHRGPKRVGGFTSGLTQTALFSTFDHPVLPDIKARLRANGPSGIMQRLVQALPASTVRYYYNYSTNYLSSSTGSYASGYPNRYSYYSTLYLGYHIAGDSQAWGVTQRDFETLLAPSSAVERPFPLPTVEFGHGTACGVYNWELFFHVPMIIGDRLSQDLRFEDAMKWYHYVFDPRQDLNQYEKTKRWADTLPPGSRYWNFLPFFANRDATDTLLDVFGVKEALSTYERNNLARVIDDWRNHPFSPHLIARQRVAAYQKFVVMKYLDNLIAWADQLFRRDSFESINQATQLYLLAADILGTRPEIIEPLTTEPRYTYRELEARGISDFANALVEVESLMVASSKYVEGSDVDAPPAQSQGVQATALLSLYFSVPRNERLDRYWDTVQDRLFKIRNSMNIDGVKRTLSLFEPPIDPALLVRAAAAGLDLGAVLSQLSRPLPCYRFNVWMQKSMELANELKSFGSALLAALEKSDAEELAQLRQSHETRMLKLMRDVRKEQLREAEQNVEVLEARRKLAEDRFADYSSREFISPNEAANLTLTARASSLETAAGVLNTIGGALGAIPQIQAGFISASAEFGGLHLANIFSAIATGMNTGAGVMRSSAVQASTIAGYERRQQDWDLQARQAKLEMENIDKELIAAEIRVNVAQKELENQEVQIEQSEEVGAFLQEKFTNKELYQWMITQLSRTYQQIYKLTYDVAKTAERAFQFELGENDTNFIQFAYMDSLRHGLLAGEKLTYDLKRMDIAYLERNKRELELTKPISLAAINALALQDLREKGSCEFSLPEVLFDLDFPGQYFRRIRAVRLTIPCVTGPYTTVSAKLSLLGSAIRVESTATPTAAEYPYKGYEDSRFVHDVGGIQSIATSTAQDDAGLFELNFRDERYLPFEGAGAISRFRLELPEKTRQFDYHTISDVVVTMSYTAREAGGSLKQGAQLSVEDQLNAMLKLVSESPTGLVRVLSMKREFPQVLHQLLSSGTATLRLLPEHFPYLLRQQRYGMKLLDPDGNLGLHAVLRATLPNTAQLTLALNGGTPPGVANLGGAPVNGVVTTAIPRGTADLLPNWAPEEWVLAQQELTPENIDDLLFVVEYTVES